MLTKKSYSLLTVLLVLLITLPEGVNAELEWDHRYTITGIVTDVNEDIAKGIQVEINCEENMTHGDLCGHNEDRSSTTGGDGVYSLILHIHTGDHGKKIVIKIEGEMFEHIIDLNGEDDQQEPEDRDVKMDIQISIEVSTFGYYIPFIIIGMIIITVSLIVMKKKNLFFFKPKTTPRKKKNRREGLIDCPKCDAQLRDFNLERHLSEKHYLNSEEIANLVLNEES
jgi:hypothetical protein